MSAPVTMGHRWGMMGSCSSCCLTRVSISLREMGKQHFRTHWQFSDAKNGKLESQLCHRLISTDLGEFFKIQALAACQMRYPRLCRWCASYLYGAFKVPIRNVLIMFPIENRAKLFTSLLFSVFNCKIFHGQLISKVLRCPLSHGALPSLPLPKRAGGRSLSGFDGKHNESTRRNFRALLPC